VGIPSRPFSAPPVAGFSRPYSYPPGLIDGMLRIEGILLHLPESTHFSACRGAERLGHVHFHGAATRVITALFLKKTRADFASRLGYCRAAGRFLFNLDKKCGWTLLITGQIQIFFFRFPVDFTFRDFSRMLR
jgi:hypothetical protein